MNLSSIYNLKQQKQRVKNIKRWLDTNHPPYNLAKPSPFIEVRKAFYEPFKNNPDPNQYFYFYDNQTNQIIDQSNIESYYFKHIKPLTDVLKLHPEIRGLSLHNTLSQISISFHQAKADQHYYVVITKTTLNYLDRSDIKTLYDFNWNQAETQIIWHLNTDGIYNKSGKKSFLLTINRSIDQTFGDESLLYDYPELKVCKSWWQEAQAFQNPIDGYDNRQSFMSTKTTITYTEILRNQQLNREELLCQHWKRLNKLQTKINLNDYNVFEINMLRSLYANVTDQEFDRVVNWWKNNPQKFAKDVYGITIGTRSSRQSNKQWMILYIDYLIYHFKQWGAISVVANDLEIFLLVQKKQLKAHHKLEFPSRDITKYINN